MGRTFALALLSGALLYGQPKPWDAACAQVADTPIPASDRPTAAESAALSKCSSEDLYFGFDKPADPVKARKCAYLEMEHPAPYVRMAFAGPAMLAMIYANGKGVPRNFDLAIKFACQIDGANAEIDSRIEHLQRLKREHWTGNNFSICDDATSGFLGSECVAVELRFAEVKRRARLNAILAKWTPADRTAFQPLERIARTFFDTRASHEIDRSGTLRAAFQLEESARLEVAFLTALQRFEAGRLPAFTESDFETASAAMNAQYAKMLALDRATPGLVGSVEAEDVEKTQAAWTAYRDAWVEFARRKYPAVAPESWKTLLIRERTKMLEDTAKLMR